LNRQGERATKSGDADDEDREQAGVSNLQKTRLNSKEDNGGVGMVLGSMAERGNLTITISQKVRLRAALGLAIAADLVQMAVFPLFIEGAASPADDVLDLAMAGVLSFLLGWHWEFAPSFFAKLVPGIDFVPLWTMAVANVWRKSGRATAEPEGKVIDGEAVRKDVPDARVTR
jgi:hypothetical protein